MKVITNSLETDFSFVFQSLASAPGIHIPEGEGLWVPFEPGIENRFLLFNLKQNSFVIVFRAQPGSATMRHYHCSPVIGLTMQGAWKYREYDWVARAGSFVYEPAGEAHTLENIGEEPMITLFHVMGPSIQLDESGEQIGYVDAFSMLEYSRDYCKKSGISTAYLDKITF